MPDRQQTPADPGTAFQLGKIEGQLRELIHTQNNQAMKGDAVAEKISKLENLPEDIGEIKQGLAKLDTRLTTLEVDKHRRDGAMGFGGAMARSPIFQWLGLALVALWAWWKGHGQ